MNLFNKIKKYFTYDDKLRVIVSIITGILVAILNTISGFIIIHVFSDVVFGIHNINRLVLILYVISGIIVGAGVLGLCILFIELMLKGIEIEKYSYLRLVLLASVVTYLLVLIFYLIFVIITSIESKIMPVFYR